MIKKLVTDKVKKSREEKQTKRVENLCAHFREAKERIFELPHDDTPSSDDLFYTLIELEVTSAAEEMYEPVINQAIADLEESRCVTEPTLAEFNRLMEGLSPDGEKVEMSKVEKYFHDNFTREISNILTSKRFINAQNFNHG